MKNLVVLSSLVFSTLSSIALGECGDLSGKWALESCSVGKPSHLREDEIKVIKVQQNCQHVEVTHQNHEGKSYTWEKYKLAFGNATYESGGNPFTKQLVGTKVELGQWQNNGNVLLVQRARASVRINLGFTDDGRPVGIASKTRYSFSDGSLEIQEKTEYTYKSEVDHSICKYVRVQ